MERTLPRLEREDVQLLLSRTRLGRVKEGGILIREGQPPAGLFIVHAGRVLLRHRPNGYDVALATLGPGQLFGESAFISPSPQPAAASAVAAVDSEVFFLAPPQLNPLFDTHPGLAGRFFQSIGLVLARRLRSIEQGVASSGEGYGDLRGWVTL